MDAVAGQARRQLPRQLRRQRLVVADDEGRPADPRDDVRHDVRLASAGDPAEDAEFIPRAICSTRRSIALGWSLDGSRPPPPPPGGDGSVEMFHARVYEAAVYEKNSS